MYSKHIHDIHMLHTIQLSSHFEYIVYLYSDKLALGQLPIQVLHLLLM